MMIKNRKTAVVTGLILILAVLIGVFFFRGKGRPVYGQNLLKNSGFEQLDEAGMPLDWLSDAYNRRPDVSEFSLAAGRDGHGVRIRNVMANDARFIQTLPVLPDTIYRLSGWVMASVESGRGANLSIADVYNGDEGLLDTGGEWRQFTVYGRTTASQRELTVYLRVGGYSADSVGEASFDDVSLTAVERAPQGAAVESWDIWQPRPVNTQAETAARPAWPYLALIGFAWIALALWMAYKAEEADARPALPGNREASRLWLPALLFGALALRLVLALFVEGYGVDIGCFTSWADRMALTGPAGFYLTETHSDYPPGYMLVLWPLGLIGRMTDGATAMLVKLPAILCDLLAAALLYRAASKRMKPGAALPLAALYAFNPLAVVTGAAWGQVDSVPAVLLLAVLLFAMEGKWRWALPLYTLAALMKPQALMFGPLGLVALAIQMWRGKAPGRWRDLMVGVGLSLLAMVAVVLPFSLRQGGVGWLIKLYGDTMNFYHYATVNATNLYFLFGLNWQPVAGEAPFALRLLGGLTLILPALCCLFGGRAFSPLRGLGQGLSLKEKLVISLALLPALIQISLPLSLGDVGTVLMVSAFLLVLLVYALRPDIRKLPLLGAVLLILFCELGVMMHERYLFPAALLLTLAYALRRDRRVLWLMLGMTLLTFLNVSVALDRGIRIGGVEGHLAAPLFGISSDSAALEYLLSALHVLLAAAACCTGLMSLRDDRPPVPPFHLRAPAEQDLEGREERERRAMEALLCGEAPPRMRGRDWLIVVLVTLLYGALALSNLGAATAPETAWISMRSDETLVYDLGSSRRFHLLYYPGIQWADNDLEVSAGDDMDAWAGKPMSLRPGDCFAWRYHTEVSGTDPGKYSGVQVVHEGRYLRIRANFSQSMVYEIIARDAESGKNIPLRLVSGEGKALIDEQDRLVGGEPSWYNGAYFDEIYHARTAFEQANALRGLEPSRIYETSHPPLGKLLISLSILIFGMNPFGWRLAGALAGVLMLPGMYLMARMVTRRRLFALAAMLLMALDHMHFVQTRIATIDSFVTLFIIWAYVFMLRFALTPLRARALMRDIGVLFLSGLFMGLAIASKWTGIYAGLGLAVIFFIALWRRTREGMAAERLAGEGADPAAMATAEGWRRRILLTLASCLISFVAVPLVIYYLSFIPVFMQTPGGLTVKKVIDASQSMLSYHATPGLGMDHYYYSPWYEWPLMIRPMWFYAGKRIADTGSTIVTFGNPAVWWGGLAALAATIVTAARRAFPGGGQGGTPWREKMGAWFLIIGFMAQYLPWIPVPRGTYIYHYFPALPFVILCIAYAFHRLDMKRPRLAARLCAGFLLLAAAVFAAFFPFASGIRVSVRWLTALQWFPNWLHF